MVGRNTVTMKLTEKESLEMDIANLEEAIKTKQFEIKDKEYDIKELEKKVAELKGEKPCPKCSNALRHTKIVYHFDTGAMMDKGFVNYCLGCGYEEKVPE